MSKKRQITVLISGAGTVTCQSVIKAYRCQDELDVRVVTMDMNPDCAGRYMSDAFYRVPAADEPAFLNRVLDICDREQVGLLIPIVDYEFVTFAKYCHLFAERGCFVAISDVQTIGTCMDKVKTYGFFRQHGIPTTWTRELSTVSEVESHDFDYPVFVKPRVGRASLDAALISSPEALAQHIKHGGEFIVQGVLHGQEYTVDVLNDLHGNTIAAVPRARIETKSGVSYKGRTVRHEELIAWAKLIAETVGIIGHANIQCFQTLGGLRFTEINPRYAGTMVLSLAAGVNSPLLLAKMVLGESVRPQIGRFREGVTMLRYWEEVFVDEHGKPFRLSAEQASNGRVAGAEGDEAVRIVTEETAQLEELAPL